MTARGKSSPRSTPGSYKSAGAGSDATRDETATRFISVASGHDDGMKPETGTDLMGKRHGDGSPVDNGSMPDGSYAELYGPGDDDEDLIAAGMSPSPHWYDTQAAEAVETAGIPLEFMTARGEQHVATNRSPEGIYWADSEEGTVSFDADVPISGLNEHHFIGDTRALYDQAMEDGTRNLHFETGPDGNHPSDDGTYISVDLNPEEREATVKALVLQGEDVYLASAHVSGWGVGLRGGMDTIEPPERCRETWDRVTAAVRQNAPTAAASIDLAHKLRADAGVQFAAGLRNANL